MNCFALVTIVARYIFSKTTSAKYCNRIFIRSSYKYKRTGRTLKRNNILEIGKGAHVVLVDIAAKYFLHGSDSRIIVYHHSLEGKYSE